MSLDTFFASLTSTKAVIPDADNPSLVEGGDANFNDSKTYQWKGPELTSDIGTPIPIVYGRHKVAGNIINAYVESGENDTLNMLIALCEGPVNSVSNVKLNGAPIEDFYGTSVDDPYGENAEITFKHGLEDQTVIQEFGDIHSLHNLDVTLQQNEEYVHTTDLSDTMAFIIELESDSLYQLDENNNKVSWYYAVKVEYKVNGTSDWQFGGIHEINKISETSIRRFIKSEYLTPNKYDIRITKLSEDPDASSRFGSLKIKSIDEVVNLELQYPFVALLGVRLVATQKLSESTPNITAEVEGRKVRIPDVRYGGDPIDWEDYYWDTVTQQFRTLAADAACTWDGTSYIEAFSANPAWCLRDLLTNSRYGLGQFILTSDIDDASFLAAAKYCDEGVENVYGKKEKRTRLDIVLDRSNFAPDIVNNIAATFRGLISYSNGKVRLVIENAVDYTQIFNMGNIVKDSFSMRYHSAKEVPNILILEYTNKDKDYARDAIEVADEDSIAAGNPIRQERIQFFGATRPSQLIREGRILVNKLKSNTRSISFKAYTDALLCQPGDVILFQHDVPQWSYGGRIGTGSSTTRVYLDKTITLEPATTYKVSVRNNQDDTIEERTVTNLSGSYNYVDLDSALSFTPQQYDLWVVGEAANLGMEYRVMGITRTNEGFCHISAVQYTASVYDDSSIQMPEDDFSYISLEIPNVYSLNCDEQVSRENDGTIRDTVLVSFRRPPNSLRWIKKAVMFHIYYSDNGGKNWTYAGATETEEFTITDPLAIGKSYTIAVVSEADTGETNMPANSPQDTVTILGWTRPASDVTGFYYDFRSVIEFYWDKNEDPDHMGYEIRTEDADWGQDDPELIWRGNAERYILENPQARQGITYYIKAFNTSLQYSTNPASVNPINLAPTAPFLAHTLLFEKVFLFWGNVVDADVTHYEVWQNDNDNWVGIEQGNERMTGEVVGTSVTQILPFETTYYRIRPVDSLGPGAWSNSINVDRMMLSSGDINPDAIGTEHIQAGAVTAAKILAGAIETGHISAKAILADQIDVASLSAISAHLGTIESGLVIGATIRTSDFDHRVEMNQAGIFAYDNNGVVRTKLVRGELCLIDPQNSDFYSYLDSGALKFHHPYGTVPYVKRVASGCAQTGATVFLQQWFEQPEITVSVNRLSSFKTSNSESDQEWTVYHDNVRQYDNGGGDFGWAFDIHSKLVISGGTKAETIYYCNFEQTVCTDCCVCQVLVKNQFQLWCHQEAPANYYYGVECYEIRYRQVGCGVWCSCEYMYTQPHSSVDMMNCTQTMCHTLVLPPNEWEIQSHRLSINWYDSGIQSGQTLCCWCCFQYEVDCSYWYYKYYTTTVFPNGDSSFDETITYQGAPGGVGHSFSFDNPAGGGEAYAGVVSYHAEGNGNRWYSGYATYSGPAHGWGGPNYYCSGNFSSSGGFRSSVGFSQGFVVDPYWGGGYLWNSARASSIKQLVCYRCCCKCCCVCQCWCCYQYPVYIGNPETCILEKLYSTTETTDEETILDGVGKVNYLAVAYA